jgi:hypothetical protein
MWRGQNTAAADAAPASAIVVMEPERRLPLAGGRLVQHNHLTACREVMTMGITCQTQLSRLWCDA